MELLHERVLNAVQRRKRSLRLKSRQPKIQAQRERRKHHMASSPALKRRARNLARRMVRDRVGGKGKGSGYSKMTVSQKMVIDQMISKYGDRINKLAKLLMPMIRRSEMTRMQRVQKTTGNTKLTGGVGRLHSSYEYSSDSTLITEKINDSRLERLIIAGVKGRGEIPLLKKLLGDTTNFAKMEIYRKKILRFLDDILEVITNDIQLTQRTEMGMKRKKLSEDNHLPPPEVGTDDIVRRYSKMTPGQENVLDTIKKVILETLTSRKSIISPYGRSGTIKPSSRFAGRKRDPVKLGRNNPRNIGIGRGRVRSVSARPKNYGATTAGRSTIKTMSNAAKMAKKVVKTGRRRERQINRMNRHIIQSPSRIR